MTRTDLHTSAVETEGWVDPPYTPAAALPIMQADPSAFRILFVGNSITRHGVNNDTIANLKWSHVAGMAASSEENDYAHLFGQMVRSALGERTVELYFDDINAVMKEDRASDPLVGKPFPAPHLVILQTGEHEGPGKTIEQLEEEYEKSFVVPYLRQVGTGRLICVGVWNPTDHQAYQGLAKDINLAYENVCNRHGVAFVSVESIATDPTCWGWGETTGVQWHPNDKGMRGYAKAIFEAFLVLRILQS